MNVGGDVGVGDIRGEAPWEAGARGALGVTHFNGTSNITFYF